MEKLNLRNYEFIPNKQLIGRIIQTERKKLNMSSFDLADKLFFSRKTINSWEEGVRLPELESLELLAQLFNMSLDELILSKAKFYLANVDDEKLDIDSYAYVWYLIEKVIFSYLSLMEAKKLDSFNYSNLLVDKHKVEFELENNSYLKALREKYGNEYRKKCSKNTANEIMLEARKRVRVIDRVTGNSFYYELIQGYNKYKNNINRLNDFDLMLLASILRFSNHKDILNDLANLNAYYLDINLASDDMNERIDLLYGELEKLDLKALNGKLKPLKEDLYA